MAIDFGLANQQPLNGLQALQYFGQAQQDQLALEQQRIKQATLQRQQQARPEIAGLVNAGNFEQAQRSAVAIGDTDYAKAIAGLEQSHREQLGRETETIGRVAQALRSVPVDQRMAQLEAFRPQLNAAGISDQELTGVDVTDNGLNGYISLATTLKDQLDAYNKANEPRVLGRNDQLYVGGNLVAQNTLPAPPEYVFDSESGDWLLKPDTGGTAAPTSATGGAATIAPAAAVAAGSGSLAETNNNPGNIIDGPWAQSQPGYAGNNGRFAVFSDAGAGANGQQNLLASYMRRGLTSPAAIIERWAPRRSRGGDNTDAQVNNYISYVANRLGVDPSQGLDAQAIPQLAAAMAEFESGNTRRGVAPQSAPQQSGGAPARIPSGRGPRRQQAPSGYQYDGGGNLAPIRGGPADPGAPSEVQKSEMALRKEFDDQPVAKTFATVRPAFNTLARLANAQNERVRKGQKPSAADDIAIVFAYMKLLDPSSVVRETEYATAKNAGGVEDRVRNLYNSLLDGTFLTPEQRANAVRAAQQAYQQHRAAYNGQSDRYRELAREYGFNENRIAPLYLTNDEIRQRQAQRRGGGQSSEAARLKQKYGLQ